MFRLNSREESVSRPRHPASPGSVCVIGPPASPLEFSRFLLSSAGLHLVLAWAVMTVGLRGPVLSERPLIVRLVETEAPKSSPTPGQQARARIKQSEPPAATEPAGPKEIAQSRPPLPSIVRPEADPTRTMEMIGPSPLDESWKAASSRAARELVTDLGLPGRTLSAVAQKTGAGGTTGPKSVGAPSGVAMLPGAGAREGIDSGPNLLGGATDRGGQGSSRGDSEKGLTGGLIPPLPKSAGVSIGKAGGGGGPRVIGGGAAVAIPSGGLSSGPALVGSLGGEASVRQAGRGEASRPGEALTAQLAPTVTVGSRRATRGRGAGGGGDGVASGKSIAANYADNPLPAYPAVAREKGYEGTVHLRVLVQGDGRVGRLTVDRSSGYDVLDRAAVDSVKKWMFLPAQKGGKSVESWVLLPVKFRLD